MSPKRKINDCFHYYTGFCYKGNNCPYRHEPRALGSNRVCKLWRRHHCFIPHCPHRHSLLRSPRKISPRYWEDRSGRSPFLKSRYFTLCGPASTGKSKGWTRSVFFPASYNSQENVYSPRTSDREWNGELEGRYPLRENIRVVLEWIDESPSRTLEGTSSARGISNNFLSSVGTQCSLHQNSQATEHAGNAEYIRSEQKCNSTLKFERENSNPDLLASKRLIRNIKAEVSDDNTQYLQKNDSTLNSEKGNSLLSSTSSTHFVLNPQPHVMFSEHKNRNINSGQKTDFEEGNSNFRVDSNDFQTQGSNQNRMAILLAKNISQMCSDNRKSYIGQNGPPTNDTREWHLREGLTTDESGYRLHTSRPSGS